MNVVFLVSRVSCVLTFMPASQSNQLSWLLLHSLSDCFGGVILHSYQSGSSGRTKTRTGLPMRAIQPLDRHRQSLAWILHPCQNFATCVIIFTPMWFSVPSKGLSSCCQLGFSGHILFSINSTDCFKQIIQYNLCISTMMVPLLLSLCGWSVFRFLLHAEAKSLCTHAHM